MKKIFLGEEHPDVATTLNDLANLYFSQELYDKAQLLYKQALKIREKRLGTNHPQTITVAENLENLRTSIEKK